MKNKKIEFYKKWWFWTIIILLTLLIIETAFFIITLKGRTKDNEIFNSSTSYREELMSLAKQINTTLGHSNVYFSSDGSLMFIEIRNWNSEYNSTKLKDLFKILENDYCKEHISTVTITTYFESSDNQGNLVIRHVYNLKTKSYIEESETYIDYDTYSSLFDNYSNLFNTVLN